MLEGIYQFFKHLFDPVGKLIMAFHMDQVSSYASDIDSLIGLVAVIVGFWFILAEGALFYFVWKFRKRDGHKAQYITGTRKQELRWIAIPHDMIIVCDALIIFMAITVWYKIKQDLPPTENTVRVIAQQWSWTFVHPGPDGKLDTDDDITTTNELHVQVNKLYHYKLESLDVLHDFSVPVFRLKHDAIPGRIITGWFEPIHVGEHDIQCAEICGIGHGLMMARIFIESPEAHAAWVATHSKDQRIAALSH